MKGGVYRMLTKKPRTAPFHYPHKAAVAVYGLLIQGVSSGRKSAGVIICYLHCHLIWW